MFFEFDDEQRAYADSVDSWLRAEYSTAELRRAWDVAGDYDRSWWTKLGTLGLSAMIPAEVHGGAGAGLTDLVLPLEHLGYSGIPEPIVESVVAAETLMSYGDEDTNADLLPKISSGEAMIAIELDGALVSDAVRADVILSIDNEAIRILDASDIDGPVLRTEDPSRRLVDVDRGLPVLWTSQDDNVVSLARSAYLTGISLLSIGLAQRLLDDVREYVVTREQFGRPIGGFQAVKHRLADTAVRIEAARSLTWRAAYAVEHRLDDVSEFADMARSMSSRALDIAGKTALQGHGGIGFTWEFDLHLFLQRGRALEAIGGSGATIRQRLGKQVLARQPA